VKTALILPVSASSFRRVAGLPLLQRTVLSVLRCGFDRIVVVGGRHTEQIRALLRADERTRAVEVADAVPAVEGLHVAVIPSDCVLTAATLERVATATLNGRPLLFRTAGNSALALCRPAMLANIDIGALAEAGSYALWEALQARGAESLSLDGDVCAPITDERSVVTAERALCAQLRADSAENDGPLAHWVDRRISLRISRWLVNHTRLRPNHITIIGTTLGLLAAAVLSVGTYWTGVIGTMLFLCTTIIDGCDGEVARLTFRESTFGEKFDVITDNIVHVAIFIGIATGLYRQNPSGHYGLLIGLLLCGFACDGALSYFFLVRRPGFARSGGPPKSFKGKVRQWMLRGLEKMMNRDFAYLLILFAVAGRLDWFFWGTAFGTYLFAIVLVSIYRWRDAT